MTRARSSDPYADIGIIVIMPYNGLCRADTADIAKATDYRRGYRHNQGVPERQAGRWGALKQTTQKSHRILHKSVVGKVSRNFLYSQIHPSSSPGFLGGVKPIESLNDIVRLYDSQSDLYKLGRGWDENLFSFKEYSSAGWSSTIKYTTDVVNTFAWYRIFSLNVWLQTVSF